MIRSAMLRSLALSLTASAAALLVGCGTAPDAAAQTASVGSEAPRPIADFTLTEAGGGEAFTLAEARGEWVALHFLLKTDCPLCARTTDEYAARAGELPNVRHVFIKPDEASETVAWTARLKPATKEATPIFRDPNAELATALGVPDGYQFHGESVHYPALILIDPQGREVYRYIGSQTRDRVAFDTFKLVVDQLQS